MAKSKDETKSTDNQAPQRVKSPKVKAGECPKNKHHKNTRVYKTDGRTRRCKCNDCGHTWKITGDYADDLRQYVHELANDLENAGTIDTEDGPVVVLTDKTRQTIVSDLRELLEGE